MPEAKDYVWIKKYGQLLGSFPYYIRDEQERAKADGAPLNSVHEKSGVAGERTHIWVTTDDIKSVTTRHALGLPPLPTCEGSAGEFFA